MKINYLILRDIRLDLSIDQAWRDREHCVSNIDFFPFFRAKIL